LEFRVEGLVFRVLGSWFQGGARQRLPLVLERDCLERNSSSSSLLLSSLELSDTKVYEPYIRALLGTASQFCEVVVLKSNATERN